MGRKKKIVETTTTSGEVEVPTIPATMPEGELPSNDTPKIASLAVDFGRTDLNALAAKLNEVIERVNSL